VEPERAWTDSEALRLLEGRTATGEHVYCTHPMRLLMRVAALPGARQDAILRMGVDGDCFLFPPQKKETVARRVPIHSSLSKLASDYSFPWPTSGAASQARSL
jgi:hypothetical protein